MAVLTLVSTGGSLVLDGLSISYQSSVVTKNIVNQKVYSATGVPIVFSNRVYQTNSKLLISNLPREKYTAFMAYVVEVLRFRNLPFSATVNTFDLGAGVGMQVDNCRLVSSDTVDWVKPKPPSLYDITFPFLFNKAV